MRGGGGGEMSSQEPGRGSRAREWGGGRGGTGNGLGHAQGRRTGGRGGGGGAQHYGPRGRSGLQVPILVRGRPPRRGRGCRQERQLEQAAQGGPGDHLGVFVTAPRRAPAVRCRGMASWRSANAAGPARPYVSWDRGTKRHAHVPVRPYLSRFNASLDSADTPVPQAAVATAKDASG